MPLYRFHCRQCGDDFELYLRISETREGQRCPSCGSGDTERVDDPADARTTGATVTPEIGLKGTT